MPARATAHLERNRPILSPPFRVARFSDAVTRDTTADRIAFALACALLLSGAVVATLMAKSDLRLAAGAAKAPFYLAAMLVALLRFGLPRTGWRHARALGDFAEFFALFTVMALMGAVATYPLAALSHGFHDATLQRVDHALGFDWLAWYRIVADHRWLQIAGTAAYRSIYISPALLLGYFAFTGRRSCAYRFLAGFWLAAAITLALFPLMPALGPLSYLWQGAIPYMPDSAVWQATLIPPLRADQFHWVELSQLRGLVEAPSFHAAAATLYIATAWRVALLRWPLLALNGAMLLSTPVEGTHYAVDLLMGIAVAATALVLVELFHRRFAAAQAG